LRPRPLGLELARRVFERGAQARLASTSEPDDRDGEHEYHERCCGDDLDRQ
jgi:hypothetical protein